MSQASALEQYLLELINAERAKVGAQPLALNDNLNTGAELHSQWMIPIRSPTPAREVRALRRGWRMPASSSSLPGPRARTSAGPVCGALPDIRMRCSFSTSI